ncbi:MAG: hypothetical protein ACKVH1_17030, partial [Alphaproteobacteria bacterium]
LLFAPAAHPVIVERVAEFPRKAQTAPVFGCPAEQALVGHAFGADRMAVKAKALHILAALVVAKQPDAVLPTLLEIPGRNPQSKPPFEISALAQQRLNLT